MPASWPAVHWGLAKSRGALCAAVSRLVVWWSRTRLWRRRRGKWGRRGSRTLSNTPNGWTFFLASAVASQSRLGYRAVGQAACRSSLCRRGCRVGVPEEGRSSPDRPECQAEVLAEVLAESPWSLPGHCHSGAVEFAGSARWSWLATCWLG